MFLLNSFFELSVSWGMNNLFELFFWIKVSIKKIFKKPYYTFFIYFYSRLSFYVS